MSDFRVFDESTDTHHLINILVCIVYYDFVFMIPLTRICVDKIVSKEKTKRIAMVDEIDLKHYI